MISDPGVNNGTDAQPRVAGERDRVGPSGAIRPRVRHRKLAARGRLLLTRLRIGAVRKFLVAIAGGIVVVVGIAMIVLPGPAILLIPLGLMLLATEFVWAKRWLKRTRNLLSNRGVHSMPVPGDINAWHHLPAEDLLGVLGVDRALGLGSDEVRERQSQYGENRATIPRAETAWRKFLQQFSQPLIYILLGAAAITAFLRQWVDASVIFGVVILNAIAGFLQQAKAEKAIEALTRMIRSDATVRREGRTFRIPSEELVPGDIVLLQGGDRVPADLRLLGSRNLQIDESALTGESLPVAKSVNPVPLDSILAERTNVAYAGTLVSIGYAEGVVSAIGNRTEAGRIAGLISNAVDLSTPLTRKLSHFSNGVLWVILALTAGAFAIGIARGAKPAEMFMASVALAVGAIPEALPAAVTIALAVGVSRMARQQALIRKLPVVETLGSTTVICSDKTGTLTENQLTVQQVFAAGRHYQLTGSGYESVGDICYEGKIVDVSRDRALVECMRAGALCNDSHLSREAGHLKLHGDPTEAAMWVAAEKAGLKPGELRAGWPRVDMIPFEPDLMFRATLHESPAGAVAYVVGAIERILERCSDMLGEGGEWVTLDKHLIHQVADSMASQGLRVLALARRNLQARHADLDLRLVNEGLTFLGLQAMADPPRPEAIASVRECQRAGIAVKMITGDHLRTAQAIGIRIGLKGHPEHGKLVALSGRELAEVSDADLPEIAERTAIFARVTPRQKLRLVRALQQHGHVVAMTGDGVNDAPALRQADIGIAMGSSGTDVAKAAAAMILTDDNFASIKAAVEEGRGVFDNLTKFIVWTLPTNVGEAMVLLVAILFGTVLPVLPVQLLWVNLVTSVLLGLALVFEPKEAGLMSRPPRDPKRKLFTVPLLLRTGLVTLILTTGSFWLFFWEIVKEGASESAARTAVINVIVLVEIAYLFSCRSLTRSVFRIGWITNPLVIEGSMAMFAAQLLFTYAPIMNKLFHTTPLNLESWLRIFAVASGSFLAVEIEKWIRFGGQRKGAIGN